MREGLAQASLMVPQLPLGDRQILLRLLDLARIIDFRSNSPNDCRMPIHAREHACSVAIIMILHILYDKLNPAVLSACMQTTILALTSSSISFIFVNTFLPSD